MVKVTTYVLEDLLDPYNRQFFDGEQVTSLACMNFGAGYYDNHTLQEYVVPEEMDNAAAMGLYLIGQLGNYSAPSE